LRALGNMLKYWNFLEFQEICPGGEVETLGTANPSCAGSIPAQDSRVWLCQTRGIHHLKCVCSHMSRVPGWWNGRHEGLKIPCQLNGVRVRVPLPAPKLK
jgi:hypothetical protein